MGDENKKIAVAGLASILLVAMVVGVTIGVTGRSSSSSSSTEPPTITATTKVVDSICNPTDYKKTCEESLADANSTDPKDLVKQGFEVGVAKLRIAIRNSTLYKNAQSDFRTKAALDVCEEVLDVCIEDLRRSFEDVGHFNHSNLKHYIEDVKTWLSGAIDHHETCIDAFDNTTGETGDKFKHLLNISGQLLSNSLAMVTDFSTIVKELGLKNGGGGGGGGGGIRGGAGIQGGGPGGGGGIRNGGPVSTGPVSGGPVGGGGIQRRLLMMKDGYPYFVDAAARKLMAENASTVNTSMTVAADGSGDYKTIMSALNTLPVKNNATITIHIKAGTYKEDVVIAKKVNNVKFIGDGPGKTIISGSKNFIDGVATYKTSVLSVNADGFMAKDLTVENTAGAAKHQAVAVRVSGDKAIFHNVNMEGYQDTLYAHSYRQFYRDCSVSGTIDFVFGDAQAVFQNCKFIVRMPMDNQACMITAQGRKDKRSLGVTVIQNGEIICEPAVATANPAVKAYLGRPWKEFSRTIYMQSNIDGFIDPEGWSVWNGDFALNTLYYAEYQNRGKGSNTTGRVKWNGIKTLTAATAESFTAAKVYAEDSWVTSAGVPYVPGMMTV